MHSTSSTDKLYSQLTALTSGKKHFVQIIDTVPTLSQAKSISCRQFAHMQLSYVSQNHLLQSVCTLATLLRQPKPFASVSLYTCNPLTSAKNICFSQFAHMQPSYVSQNHLLQSVCTLATLLRRAKPFASVSLYTCSPLTSGKTICFSQFVHLQPAYVGQNHFVQARPPSPWKKRHTAGKLNINLSLQC